MSINSSDAKDLYLTNVATETKQSIEKIVWHIRLDHPHYKVLQAVVNKFCNKKVVASDYVLQNCSAYKFGKLHQQPFSHSESVSIKILELVIADLWVLYQLFEKKGYK